MSLSIKFDAAKVLANSRNFIRAHAAQIEAAVYKVGLRRLRDAVTIEPRPPIEWGTLRGSGNVATRNHGEGDKAGLGRFANRVSFDTAYAARHHEATPQEAASWPSKEIDSGVGPKWLSSKDQRFGAEYNKLAAEFLGEALR